MIVSASYRTDVPAFYGEWFRRRLDAGFAMTVNPYGGSAQRVALDRDSVDGFVFWTRNLRPFFPALRDVAARGFPFVTQYTITGYPRALDAGTPAAAEAVEHLRWLAAEFGARRGVWRYDPIIATSLTPPAWHVANFASLCEVLAGVVDEVVVSFAHIYRKTARNMDAAARAWRFAWHDPQAADKRRLLTDFAAIAAAHNLAVTVCGQTEFRVPGVGEARCIDAKRLSDIAGRPIAAASKAHRACGCWASRDIGDYESCPHGCVYCYAVGNRTLAKHRYAGHDPADPFLISPGRRA